MFDLLAAVLAVLSGLSVYKWRLKDDLSVTASEIGPGYFVALSTGSIVGALALGTANLWISGVDQIGRSILGALIGAIVTVEIYKLKKGVSKSTGYTYIVPFSVAIIVGRIGCLLSGLDDNTYGVPTETSWGWDFGDQILRHPVQLYESASMLAFLIIALALLKIRPTAIVSNGFYYGVGFYGVQRFIWEFFKPYERIWLNMNIFQLFCIALLLYAVVMTLRTSKALNDDNPA